MNEENVKIKIIIQWLLEAGIDVNELQFETSFTVQLGRHSTRVQDKKLMDAARGKLDILVTRNNKNLLLIEVKAEKIALTESDRNQAISYASIVRPIPPYALVTNGKEFNLYNTLDMKPVEPESINLEGLSLSLPDDLIAEAQALFLSLNTNNLMAFCTSVVKSNLQLLKGKVEQKKKYIPQLHEPRTEIRNEVQRFLNSDDKAFILSGQSGLGKSCELCAITEELVASNKAVFFFNGSLLEGSLLEAIAHEFEWQFEKEITPVQILNRIERISRETGFVIIIDAIDEWSYEKRTVQLSNLVQSIGSKNIKLILSCKDSAFDSFMSIRGVPTYLNQMAHKTTLTPFTEDEFFRALSRYRSTYNIDNPFDIDVLTRAQENPFLLRILFDVAKESGIKDFTFEAANLFETYLSQVTEKMSNPTKANRYINAIAEAMYEKDVDRIDEDEIRSHLNLSINEDLMSELFEYGLLSRNYESSGKASINFYFQQLRDYIIAFRAIRLNNMDAKQLREALASCNFPSVRGDAFILFYRQTTANQKRLIDEPYFSYANKYLQKYVGSIERNFPMLFDRFDPVGSKRIGFVGELLMPGSRIGHYGFRSISAKDSPVEIIPVSSLDYELKDRGKNRLFRDVNTAKFSFNKNVFAADFDADTYLSREEVLPQLKQMIIEGKLNETNNPDLLEEFIVGLVLDDTSTFKEIHIDSGNPLPPKIPLSTVEACMLNKCLYYHFETEWTKAAIHSGVIETSKQGRYISYSHSWKPEDRQWIKQKVNEAIENNSIPKDHEMHTHVDLRKLSKSVARAADQLKSNNISSLSTIFMDSPKDKIISSAGEDEFILGEYIKVLYQKYFENYNLLLQTNFPTLVSLIQSINHFHSLFIVMGNRVVDRARRYERELTLYYVERKSNQLHVSVVTENDIVHSEKDWTLLVSNVEHKLVSISYTSIDSFCRRDSGLCDSEFRNMPIRSYVYSKLLDDLNELDDDVIEIALMAV